jgi:hypothetical protein
VSSGDWVAFSEGRRRGAALRSLALLVAAVALFVRTTRGGSSGAPDLVLVAVTSFLVVAALIGFLVRPLATPSGTAFLVLVPTPGGASTMPGRMLLGPDRITWSPRGGGPAMAWARGDVASAAVRRVWSFRPLGYLTLTLADGRTFEGRIFQPRELSEALVATGYAR